MSTAEDGLHKDDCFSVLVDFALFSQHKSCKIAAMFRMEPHLAPLRIHHNMWQGVNPGSKLAELPTLICRIAKCESLAMSLYVSPSNVIDPS